MLTLNLKAPRTIASSFALAVTLVTACDDHDHDHDHEDPAAEACEHLGGPPTPVTATATATGTAEVKADHKRYEVKLLDAGGGKAGVVSFNSAKTGHMLVFLSADVSLAVKTSTNLDATLNETKKTGLACPALKASYEYEVGVGRYDLTFGGTGNTTDTVGVVIEAEQHEH
jgi:hypothetical protein